MSKHQSNNRHSKDSRHIGLFTLSLSGAAVAIALIGGGVLAPFTPVHASGGSNPAPVASPTTSQNVDSVKVSKAFTNATATTGGELLIKAASSDASAHLFAYRPDGTFIGEVQNGGGGKYGGTVMPYQTSDPISITITSTSGGSITVPTTPFQI